MTGAERQALPRWLAALCLLGGLACGVVAGPAVLDARGAGYAAAGDAAFRCAGHACGCRTAGRCRAHCCYFPRAVAPGASRARHRTVTTSAEAPATAAFAALQCGPDSRGAVPGGAPDGRMALPALAVHAPPASRPYAPSDAATACTAFAPAPPAPPPRPA